MAARRSAWMLGLHFLQHWFNLSNLAAVEALYDLQSMRRFVGIDLGRGLVPDETTLLNFHHLLEQHELDKPLVERLNQHLASHGLKVAGGTSLSGVDRSPAWRELGQFDFA